MLFTSAINRLAAWRWPGLILAVILLGGLMRVVALDTAPPGLHFDEAVYGLLAEDIYRGSRPVFFASYTGREPLYMYFMAMVYTLAGVTPLAIRLTSALIGTATLATTYWLGAEWFGRRVGLFATLIIAVNYWHLTVSRNAYPNILIPPLEALSLLFLTRGYRRGRWLDFALGGVFAGAVLYTYLAARFFPVTLVAILLGALLLQGRRIAGQLGGILVAGLAGAAVVAPLVIYFVQHPADFWERANQVLVFRQVGPVEAIRIYLENAQLTYSAFFLRGDPRWHYNLPLKPVYDGSLGVLFVLGALVALWRSRRLPYLATLLWVIVMSFPSLLTAELMPATQRMFGVWPALAFLPALGLEYCVVRIAYFVERIADFVSKKRGGFSVSDTHSEIRNTKYALLTLFFVYQAWSTLDTYFNVWTPHPETVHVFNNDYLQMARLAQAEIAAGRTVVLLSEHYKHPTVIFTAPETLAAVWAIHDLAAPLPRRGDQPVVYLAPSALVAAGSPSTSFLASMARPQVSGLVTRYELAPSAFPSSAAGQTTINGDVRILGAEMPPPVARNQKAQIAVRWSVERPVAEGRTFAIHLVDQNGARWSQTDAMGYLTEQWRVGDQVMSWLNVPLDRTMPAGRYRARLLLSNEAGQPLPVLDGVGRPQGLWLDVGEVVVTRDGVRKTPPSTQGIGFANGLQLIDYPQVRTTVSPGGRLEVGVTWQARQAITTNPGAELVLITGGREWASLAMPITGDYSPTEWSEGEIVRAKYVVRLPADAPQGESQLGLRLKGEAPLAPLGVIQIAGPARLFSPPPIPHPVQARLGQPGQGIVLLGYDGPTKAKPGDSLSLTLYWQPDATLDNELKVFRHLVDATGQLRAQVDTTPANGDRPTTGWVADEVIVDKASLSLPANLPPGRYRLLTGLYEVTTLSRLPARSATGAAFPNDAIEVVEIEVGG